MTNRKAILQRPADVVLDECGVRPLARHLKINPTSVMRWRESVEGLVPSRWHMKIIKFAGGRITDRDLTRGRTKYVHGARYGT